MKRIVGVAVAAVVAVLMSAGIDSGAVAARSVPAPAATPAASGSTYTVRTGDSLFGLAQRFGIRVKALLEANGLVLTSTIRPGQVLKLPAGARPLPATPPVTAGAPTTPAPTTIAPTTTATTNSAQPTTAYVVKPGDALAGIARNNGVRYSALLKANNLTTSSVIHPGQILQIPPATLPIPAPRVPASTLPASTLPASTVPVTPAPAATGALTNIDGLLVYLRAQVGKPYRFFTAGPDTFDCSGLVVAGYQQIGMTLPHQSRALAALGVAVDWKTAPIAAGDLVFTAAGADPTMITHVGVALDTTTWIQAVGVGSTVRIGSLPTADKIVAVRRIIAAHA